MVRSSWMITVPLLVATTITLTESFIMIRTTKPSTISLWNSNPLQQKEQQQSNSLQSTSSSSSPPVGRNSNNSTNNCKALYSFTDARRMARNYQFESQEEFLEYSCPGAYQLPKNPHQVWSTEWRGWDDWLGVRLDYPIAKETARALKMYSKEDYMQLIASKSIDDNDDASRLPYQPDKIYKEDWISWEDWLGIES